MKKILIVIALLITIVGCTLNKEPYESMTQLAEYKEIEVPTNWLYTTTVKATHEFRLNDDEKLYYVPSVLKVGDDTFKNEVSGYFVEEKLSTRNMLSGEITYYYECYKITLEEARELLE